MNRHSNAYQGHFTAPKRKRARRLGGGVLALLILLLSLARLGAEAVRLLAYADVFVGGGRMLIYSEVQNVDLGPAIGGKENAIPVFTEVPATAPTEDYVVRLDNGTTLLYQGHTYRLNEDLTTILFLGIDKDIEETKTIGVGGQSDVMLVIGLDTATGETTVLILSRDLYGQVDVYSVDNQFIGTEPLQITLAYAYGDGKELSCENAVTTVSRLLYGLPISSYLALDMDGILEANELVGGVTLESLVDLTMPDNTKIREGQTVELHGKNLERYIRSRTHDLEGNSRRMERQRQYMTAFADKVIARSRDNLTFPVELFAALAPYMVTDLDISDVTFLSSTFLSHGADISYRSLSGTSDWLNGSSVLYPDEVDLFEAVLQLFYKQVD